MADYFGFCVSARIILRWFKCYCVQSMLGKHRQKIIRTVCQKTQVIFQTKNIKTTKDNDRPPYSGATLKQTKQFNLNLQSRVSNKIHLIILRPDLAFCTAKMLLKVDRSRYGTFVGLKFYAFVLKKKTKQRIIRKKIENKTKQTNKQNKQQKQQEQQTTASNNLRQSFRFLYIFCIACFLPFQLLICHFSFYGFGCIPVVFACCCLTVLQYNKLSKVHSEPVKFSCIMRSCVLFKVTKTQLQSQTWRKYR